METRDDQFRIESLKMIPTLNNNAQELIYIYIYVCVCKNQKSKVISSLL